MPRSRAVSCARAGVDVRAGDEAHAVQARRVVEVDPADLAAADQPDAEIAHSAACRVASERRAVLDRVVGRRVELDDQVARPAGLGGRRDRARSRAPRRPRRRRASRRRRAARPWRGRAARGPRSCSSWPPGRGRRSAASRRRARGRARWRRAGSTGRPRRTRTRGCGSRTASRPSRVCSPAATIRVDQRVGRGIVFGRAAPTAGSASATPSVPRLLEHGVELVLEALERLRASSTPTDPTASRIRRIVWRVAFVQSGQLDLASAPACASA